MSDVNEAPVWSADTLHCGIIEGNVSGSVKAVVGKEGKKHEVKLVVLEEKVSVKSYR